MENDWNFEIEKMLQAEAEKQQQEELARQLEISKQAELDLIIRNKRAEKEKAFENYCASIFVTYGIDSILQEILDQVWQKGEIVTSRRNINEKYRKDIKEVWLTQSLVYPCITQREVFMETYETAPYDDHPSRSIRPTLHKSLVDAISYLKVSAIIIYLNQYPQDLKFEIEGGISAPQHYVEPVPHSGYGKAITLEFTEQFILEKFASDPENFRDKIKPFIIREGVLRRQKGFMPNDLILVPEPTQPGIPEASEITSNIQTSQPSTLIDSLVKRWKRLIGNV